MNNYFSGTINYIFRTTVLFLLSYIWLNFYLRKPTLCFWLSIIIALILSQIIQLYYNRKIKTVVKTKMEKKVLATLQEFLMYSSLPKIKKYLSQIYQEDANTVNIYLFNKQVLCIDDVLNYIKPYLDTMHSITILCIDYDKSLSTLKRLKNINIININNIFAKIKDNSIAIPASPLCPHTTKIKFKELGNILINRNNYKGYLYMSFVLIISSLFVTTNLYYLIYSSLLLLLSLLSYLDILAINDK